MTTRLFKPGWDDLKRKLKRKYTSLTDADLAYVESKEDELLERMQRRLGMSPLEIAWLVDELTEDRAPGPSSGWPFLSNEERRPFAA